MAAWFTPAIATLGAAGLSYLGAERRNKQQIAAARDQMAFQERMSSSAHQRQMSDLRSAGLNPILSGKYGGSSTPTGAMPKLENSFEKVMQAMQLQAQTEQALANASSAQSVADINKEDLAWIKDHNEKFPNAKVSRLSLTTGFSKQLGTLSMSGLKKLYLEVKKTIETMQQFYKSGSNDQTEGDLNDIIKSIAKESLRRKRYKQELDAVRKNYKKGVRGRNSSSDNPIIVTPLRKNIY